MTIDELRERVEKEWPCALGHPHDARSCWDCLLQHRILAFLVRTYNDALCAAELEALRYRDRNVTIREYAAADAVAGHIHSLKLAPL